jgi:hypothetical protein
MCVRGRGRLVLWEEEYLYERRRIQYVMGGGILV